jgi:hypothetical protein
MLDYSLQKVDWNAPFNKDGSYDACRHFFAEHCNQLKSARRFHGPLPDQGAQMNDAASKRQSLHSMGRRCRFPCALHATSTNLSGALRSARFDTLRSTRVRWKCAVQ